MMFEQIEFWHWWVAGIVLIILEVFAPGFVLLWLGIAAGVVGAVLFLVPELGWQYQFLIFALVSVSSIVVGRTVLLRHSQESDHPNLNRRGEQYVGRQFTLDQEIANGTGFLKIDDARWKVTGADLPAGTKVTVVGVEGTVLKVEPA